MNAQFNWTDVAIIELKRGRDCGDSSSKIANGLSVMFQQRCSRNAVIGKVFRLGLDKRPRQPKRIMITRALAPRVARPNRKPFPRPHSQTTSDLIQGPSISELPPEVSECAIPLIEATAEHCKWPLGEPTFDMQVCGAITETEPYCKRHAQIAYRMPKYHEGRRA